MNSLVLLLVNHAVAYINPLQVGVGKIIDYQLNEYEKISGNKIRQFNHALLGPSFKALGGNCAYNKLANNMPFSDQQLAKDNTQSTWYQNDKTGTLTYYLKTEGETTTPTIVESYSSVQSVDGSYCVYSKDTPDCYGLPLDNNKVKQLSGHVENNELSEAYKNIVQKADEKMQSWDGLKSLLPDYSFLPQLDQTTRQRHYLSAQLHDPVAGGSMFSRMGLDGNCCIIGTSCKPADMTKTCTGDYPTSFCRLPTDHSVLTTTSIGDDHGKKVFLKIANNANSKPFADKIVSLDELVSTGGGMLLDASRTAFANIPDVDMCFKDDSGKHKVYTVTMNSLDSDNNVVQDNTSKVTIVGYFRDSTKPHLDATALVDNNVNNDIECFAYKLLAAFPSNNIQKEMKSFISSWAVTVSKFSGSKDNNALDQFLKDKPDSFNPFDSNISNWMDEINVIRMHLLYPPIIKGIKRADCKDTGADVTDVDYVGMVQGLTARLLVLGSYRSAYVLENTVGGYITGTGAPKDSVSSYLLDVMNKTPAFKKMLNRCPMPSPISPASHPTKAPSSESGILASAFVVLFLFLAL